MHVRNINWNGNPIGDGTGLENQRAVKSLGGSTPSHSATVEKNFQERYQHIMASEYIYLGQDWETSQLTKFGLGSVYLAGPRNSQRRSWRLDLIDKLEKTGVSLTYMIPETLEELNNKNLNIVKNSLQWCRSAISCTSAILFWFPKGNLDTISLVDFGAWCKSERVFVGGDADNLSYIDFVFHSEQKLNICKTQDELVERFISWILE